MSPYSAQSAFVDVQRQLAQYFSTPVFWLPRLMRGVHRWATSEKGAVFAQVQVRYSTNHAGMPVLDQFRPQLQQVGWWTFTDQEIRDSPAQFWILIQCSSEGQALVYLILPKADLLTLLLSIQPTAAGQRHFYWYQGANSLAFQARGLSTAQIANFLADQAAIPTQHQLGSYVNAWKKYFSLPLLSRLK